METMDVDNILLPTNNVNLSKSLDLTTHSQETQRIKEHVKRNHKDVISQIQNLDYSLKLKTVSSTTKWQPLPTKTKQ